MVKTNRNNWAALFIFVVYLIGMNILASPKVSADEAEEPVHFEDLGLKATVENKLGISDPTLSDMLDLVSLSASDRGIIKLTGLEHAINLHTLLLARNRITDISALASLTSLTILNLGHNQITDISALAELTDLTELYLDDNQITDISALAGLTNLTYLNLRNFYPRGNQIADISALAGMTNLTYLNLLGNNRITDISALAGLTRLTVLDFGNNQITDISALAGLTRLTYLNLSDNQITDISALAGLTNLTYLVLCGNQIKDISALAALTNLDLLNLTLNQITDISALEGLTNLTYLSLHSNYRVTDISALAGLTNLTQLLLAYNQITDISALEGLTGLTHLQLEGNQISDISALSGFTNLITLILEYNPLNYDAYHIYIPMIRENSPVVNLLYDPIPPEYGQEPAPPHRVFFVDDDANSGGDGSSWENALNSLQDALHAAKYGDEIRVAAGIYRPDQGDSVILGDRHATFQLNKNNLTIKGGYAGIGHEGRFSPESRNIEEFTTILSGDLSENDAGNWYHQSRKDNSFHVVTAEYTDNTALVEGFTITGGNCLDKFFVTGATTGDTGAGAGIHSSTGSPTIKDCIFTNNSAPYGGGLYGSARLIGCTFTDNYAEHDGGAIDTVGGSGSWIEPMRVEIRDCLFTRNSAGRFGAAIYGIKIKFVNSVIQDNGTSNGAIELWGSTDYIFEVPDHIIDNLTIQENCAPNTETCAGIIRDAGIKLEGDLNVTSGTLYIFDSFFDGQGKICLGQEVLFRISDTMRKIHWEQCPTITLVDIDGPGNIQVDASQRLIVGGNAIIDLHRQPEDSCENSLGGRINIDGELVLQDEATIRNSTICVNQASIEDKSSIQNNNISLLEANAGYGGQFFVQDSVSVIGNYIRSEGDRYLDLDPDPNNRNIHLSDNTIVVIIKEGRPVRQGTLLELRAKDYDVGTATNPNGSSGAHRVEESVGFTEDPSENWVLERLELQENAKLNLTNRQGFRYQDPLDPLPETVYVKELVMGSNSVLNTSLQTMYYKQLTDPNGTELPRNPDDPEAPLPNGARFTDIPLLGFSLGIIAMNDQTEFDVRIRKRLTATEDDHKQPQHPNEPLYIGSIERIDSEKNPSVPAYTGGIMEMRTQAEGKLSASSVAAKGAFARAGDEDINIQFEYLFPENVTGDAILVVYLSDNPEVGHESRVPIAMIQPPNPGRPGSIESNRFAVFSAVVPHGDLNFCRGTYVELELHGQNAQCWIDDWDPQIYCVAYCGDFNADTEIDPCDYFLLLAEFGLTNPLGANKACLDMVSDGCIGIDDLFIWDAASEIRCLCPREDSETSLTSILSNNGYSSLTVSRGRYLEVEENADLILFGKRGMGLSRPNGYIYSISQDGKCQQNASTSGTGRLVAGKFDQTYQIHHNKGLLCIDDPRKNINQSIDHDKGVSVGFNGSYQSGVPLLDAVFHPDDPSIVYVVPILAEGTDGTKYKAAAKLKLTSESISGNDYFVETIYGQDPAENLNQNITILSDSIRNQLLEPDLQHLKEIEIDPRGEYLYVLSSCLQNENNWILIYDQDTGELNGCVNLSDPCDTWPDINMPTAMVVSSINDRVYLSSSERPDDESGDLIAKVYSFSIRREPQVGSGSTIHFEFDRVIEITWPAPDENVLKRFAGLYEPDCYVSQITSMTEAPDGTLYIVGFAAPRFKEEVWKGEPAFFTQSMLTAVNPDTYAYANYKLSDVELPLSVIWK